MHHTQPVSGQALVADFQTVFVSAATVEAANYEADRSENELVGHLESISSGTFLNPGTLAGGDQDVLTRASLDAHIKKVQTRQLSDMNAEQLNSLASQDQSLYKGRRVTVTVVSESRKPIDMIWFDTQHGFRTSNSHKKSVTGTIEEVMLDRNALVLKPTLGFRLINSSLKNYLIYVIDPDSFKPMVKLDIR